MHWRDPRRPSVPSRWRRRRSPSRSERKACAIAAVSMPPWARRATTCVRRAVVHKDHVQLVGRIVERGEGRRRLQDARPLAEDGHDDGDARPFRRVVVVFGTRAVVGDAQERAQHVAVHEDDKDEQAEQPFERGDADHARAPRARPSRTNERTRGGGPAWLSSLLLIIRPAPAGSRGARGSSPCASRRDRSRQGSHPP